MLKSEKEELIKELNEKFARATSVIVAEFKKVNVDTVTRLRKKLRDGGVDYKVLKNTLAKRAAKGTQVEVIADEFVGPVAVAVAYGDVVSPAKIFTDFIKGMETFQIRSAMVEGKRIDTAGVEALAKMPGLPELRAQLLGMINQPAGKVVRTIAAPGSQLARVLQARNDAQANAS